MASIMLAPTPASRILESGARFSAPAVDITTGASVDAPDAYAKRAAPGTVWPNRLLREAHLLLAEPACAQTAEGVKQAMAELLVDPIDGDLLKDPVLAADGHTYSFASMMGCLKFSAAQMKQRCISNPELPFDIESPLTRQSLLHEPLIPNHAVRALMAEAGLDVDHGAPHAYPVPDASFGDAALVFERSTGDGEPGHGAGSLRRPSLDRPHRNRLRNLFRRPRTVVSPNDRAARLVNTASEWVRLERGLGDKLRNDTWKLQHRLAIESGPRQDSEDLTGGILSVDFALIFGDLKRARNWLTTLMPELAQIDEPSPQAHQNDELLARWALVQVALGHGRAAQASLLRLQRSRRGADAEVSLKDFMENALDPNPEARQVPWAAYAAWGKLQLEAGAGAAARAFLERSYPNNAPIDPDRVVRGRGYVTRMTAEWLAAAS